MRVLVLYATTEGQTRKVGRFVADRLTDAGFSVELLPVEDSAGLDAGRFDAAVLAGSVHLGRVQSALVDFARRQADALAGMPTLYLQVSLSAAGTDAEEWAELRAIAEATAAGFGWSPARTLQVAGAFRFSEYDFFKTWAMRWIASQKGEDVPRGRDREYTDWTALGTAVDDWAEAAALSR